MAVPSSPPASASGSPTTDARRDPLSRPCTASGPARQAHPFETQVTNSAIRRRRHLRAITLARSSPIKPDQARSSPIKPDQARSDAARPRPGGPGGPFPVWFGVPQPFPQFRTTSAADLKSVAARCSFCRRRDQARSFSGPSLGRRRSGSTENPVELTGTYPQLRGYAPLPRHWSGGAGRTSWPVSRILFPGALRRTVRRPSILTRRRRRVLAAYPQASDGPSSIACCLALLRVGFTEPPRSPGVLVVSYTTVSPLLRARVRRSGLFSVALSRGSPRVAVNNHPALRSPDFPRRRPLMLPSRGADATARPARPPIKYRTGTGAGSRRPGWRRAWLIEPNPGQKCHPALPHWAGADNRAGHSGAGHSGAGGDRRGCRRVDAGAPTTPELARADPPGSRVRGARGRRCASARAAVRRCADHPQLR